MFQGTALIHRYHIYCVFGTSLSICPVPGPSLCKDTRRGEGCPSSAGGAGEGRGCFSWLRRWVPGAFPMGCSVVARGTEPPPGHPKSGGGHAVHIPTWHEAPTLWTARRNARKTISCLEVRGSLPLRLLV